MPRNRSPPLRVDDTKWAVSGLASLSNAMRLTGPPASAAEGVSAMPLAAVSNSSRTVLAISRRYKPLGDFLRVDFLACGSSPLWP